MTRVLVPAFPAVLRVGLPVVVEGRPGTNRVSIDGYVWMGESEGDVWLVRMGNPLAHKGPLRPLCFNAGMDVLRLDMGLRCVRDELTTVMWRTLRPDEPEPITAPQWVAHDSDATPSWSLVVYDGDGDADAIYFAEHIGDTAPDGAVEVPLLVDCYEENADLLALAACATHVLA